MEKEPPNIGRQSLYNTFSLCPRCTLLEESGLALKPAEVIKQYEKIWLVVRCNIHGSQETLVCSQVEWYEKMWSVADVSFAENSIVDIEDLKKKRRPRTQTLPFLVELNVFANDQFISFDEIDAQLKRIQLLYPNDMEYVLKISGKLSDDMQEMSKIVMHVHSKTTQRILVQVSFERLIMLSNLPNSCFSKARIYPSVKYFLKKGDEKQCLDEMGQVLSVLKGFDGMKLAISVFVEKPLADLSSLLAYLRMQIGFVKFIEIVIERSPKNILRAVNTVDSANIPEEMLSTLKLERKNIYAQVIDPYDVLKQIEDATNKTVAISDFYPISMGRMFEPFLPILGLGKYQIRPSPFCGYGALLINNSEHFSVPFTRLLNFEKLYKDIVPFLPKLQEGDIGILTMAKLKSVLDSCTKPGVKLPNLLSYLIDKSKIEDALQFIDNMQLIVVHNHMDVTNLDMVRRCTCAALVKNNEGPGFVACCNNYL